MNYQLPIEVIRREDDAVLIQIVDKVETCQACQEGRGCGQNLWFRGFSKAKPFWMKAPANSQNQSFNRIAIDKKLLNRICMFTYGLPLLSFFACLFVFQFTAAIFQFLIAFASIFVIFFLLKTLFKKWIIGKISLVL